MLNILTSGFYIYSSDVLEGEEPGQQLEGHPGDTLSTFRRQLHAWAQAIGSPAAPEGSPAADGLAGARSVALVDASIRSLAADGAWVDVPDPYN